MLSEIRQRLGTKRQTRADRRAFGTIWPNGEFSLAWPKERVRETSREEEEPKGKREEYRPLVSRSHLASLCDEIHTQAEAELAEAPKRGQYGAKGITKLGKRMVRSGAALLQRKYSRFRLSFLTLTLPEFENADALVIAECWGRVINRYLQWLRRNLTRLGLPTLVVGATEVQPRRTQGGSLCGLHVHLVFVGRLKSRGQWGLSPCDLRRAWLRILGNELGKPVHSLSCEEVRMVKKSAEGYLGKYMSKGSEAVAELLQNEPDYPLPGQWWFVTKEMREWIKAETVRGPHTGSMLETLLDYLNDGNWEGSGVWAYPCHINLSGVAYLVAWVGRLSFQNYKDLTGLIELRLSAI
jgi:hypothetical protein